MPVSYNRLWKCFIDKKKSQSELKKKVVIASSTMTKIRCDDIANLTILDKICDVLQCDFADIIKHQCINDDKGEV